MQPLIAMLVPAAPTEGGTNATGRVAQNAAGPMAGSGFDALIATLLGATEGGAAPAMEGITTPSDKDSPLPLARPDQTADSASLVAALLHVAGLRPVTDQAPVETEPVGAILPLPVPLGSTLPAGQLPAESAPQAVLTPISTDPAAVPSQSPPPPTGQPMLTLTDGAMLPGDGLPIPAAPPSTASMEASGIQPSSDSSPGHPLQVPVPPQRLMGEVEEAIDPGATASPLSPPVDPVLTAPVSADIVSISEPAFAPPMAAVIAAPGAFAPERPRTMPGKAAVAILIKADGPPAEISAPAPETAIRVAGTVQPMDRKDGDDPAAQVPSSPRGAVERPAPLSATIAAVPPDPPPETAAAPVNPASSAAGTAVREAAGVASPLAPRRSATSHLSPAAQLTGRIEQAVSEGRTTLTVRLDPEALGRVEVRLEMQDGRVTASIAAERPATLDLLQRDSRLLERAVEQGGLQLSGGGLQFSLREGAGQWAEAQAGNRRGGLAYGMAAAEPAADPLSPAPYTSDSLVDIQI
ncbi:flagellar hook-length control protein FliK [Niveispirillum sp. SYP-B3756]|uniref:flagellar hook-length control protein FliK n=1 Tax=Niveispirillum sp. SYP-B3756 TaxID=2662178 RepID=UPI00156631FC|nr:flagellar hook-length control protein FliK [Niveispirillum sp. SYP-B3756]